MRHGNGTIGPSWSIWIGAQTYTKRATLPNLTPTQLPPIPKTYLPHYIGMTQAIGHLVMQVLYKRSREDRAVQNGAETIGVVDRIWPVSVKPVVWPSRYVLTTDDVAHLGTTIVVVE